jgi:hypothetical protein
VRSKVRVFSVYATLAIEAYTAISQLNTTEQAYMRQAVANKLQTRIKHEKRRNKRTTDPEKQGQRDKKLINNIKRKMELNNLIKVA